jgi:lipopolysaccharide export system protein LptA
MTQTKIHSLRATLCTALALVFASLTAGAAYAEKADRAKDIEITFARVVTDIDQSDTTVEGDVVLTQGTMRITGDRMRVKKDSQKNVTAEIFGSAKQLTFREKRDGSNDYIEGVADRAEFDQRANTLKLFSNAVINSAGNVLAGEYMVYNRVTDQFEVNGAPQNTKTGSANQQSTRGRMIIQPPKDVAGADGEKK